MPNPTGEEIERRITRIVEGGRLPRALARLIQVNGRTPLPVREAAGLIEEDPAARDRLLRLVNSSWFGLRTPVHSVQHAVALLGDRLAEPILIEAGLSRAAGEVGEREGISVARLVEHMRACAHQARLLSESLPDARSQDPDDVYRAGLLCDVGQMILLHAGEVGYESLVARAARERVPLARVEEAELGFGHAEVGSAFASRLGLGARVVEAVRHHHRPGRAEGEVSRIAALVHLADTMVFDREGGDGFETAPREFDAAVVSILGLTGDAVSELVAELLDLGRLEENPRPAASDQI